MSPKKTEKSNTNIGIFSAKSAKYNLAILETLLAKEATAWQIAEKLQKKINPSENQEVRFYRTQKVYSVIQRKKGRLNDLRDKGYIIEKNGKWAITRKGLIAVSVVKPELVNRIIDSNKAKFIELSASYTGKARTVFGLEIDLSQFKPLFEQIDFEYTYHLIVEEAKILLSSGFELDRINEDDFLSIVYSALITKGKIAELINKFVKGSKNGSS